jgi:hypothetical protein
MMTTKFLLPVETAKMGRALDGLTKEDRTFVTETIAFLGAEALETEEVVCTPEAGVLAMRIERMAEADRNVLKGLVSRIMAKNKETRRPAAAKR